ncbi:MAG: hypothetical protein KDA96_19065 [Planctomycetaceae bacterium]|nr:hypothetical protein [Planctomycetaceae bacterium]
MVAPTDYFVDPTIATDGGDGSVGNPWTRADGQVYQYALDNLTHGGGGSRVLAYGGSRHTPGLATLTVPGSIVTTYDNPLWIGPVDPNAYQADMTMDAGRQLISAPSAYCHLYGLHCPNSAITVGTASSVCRCFVGCVSGQNGIQSGGNSYVIGNAVVGTVGYANGIQASHCIQGNFVKVSISSNGKDGIHVAGSGSGAMFNVIRITSAQGNGMQLNSSTHFSYVNNNSVFAEGSSGSGIIVNSAKFMHSAWGNLIQGFDSAINEYGSSRKVGVWGNSWFDCPNGLINPADQWDYMGFPDNESLPSSPFVDPTNDDFAPVDVGSVFGGVITSPNGVYPGGFRGAIKPPGGGGGGGGGGSKLSGIRGGIRV